jgi:hypothetical protein
VRRATVLLLVPALLAGCGSSGSSEAEKASATVRQYFKAVAEGDGAGACSLLSTAGVKRIVQHTIAAGTKPDAVVCAEQVQGARRLLTAQSLAALRNVNTGASNVTGQHATVTVSTAAGTNTALLTKTSGGWRIDTLGVSKPASSG